MKDNDFVGKLVVLKTLSGLDLLGKVVEVSKESFYLEGIAILQSQMNPQVQNEVNAGIVEMNKLFPFSPEAEQKTIDREIPRGLFLFAHLASEQIETAYSTFITGILQPSGNIQLP